MASCDEQNGGGEAILTIESIYFKIATTKTVLILVEGYGVI